MGFVETAPAGRISRTQQPSTPTRSYNEEFSQAKEAGNCEITNAIAQLGLSATFRLGRRLTFAETFSAETTEYARTTICKGLQGDQGTHSPDYLPPKTRYTSFSRDNKTLCTVAGAIDLFSFCPQMHMLHRPVLAFTRSLYL